MRFSRRRALWTASSGVMCESRRPARAAAMSSRTSRRKAAPKSSDRPIPDAIARHPGRRRNRSGGRTADRSAADRMCAHSRPAVGQVNPCSIVQVMAQPSPEVVLSSSQPSPPRSSPSPQIGVHSWLTTGHEYPCSIVQVEVQPSPEVVLPSSHGSTPTNMPSPQIGAHELGSPLQVQPGSISHVALHPSPATLPPSSQASPGSRSASPHSAGSAQVSFASSASSKRSQSRCRPSTSFRSVQNRQRRRSPTQAASPAAVVASQPGNAVGSPTPRPTQSFARSSSRSR